jgi:hypothetical protein
MYIVSKTLSNAFFSALGNGHLDLMNDTNRQSLVQVGPCSVHLLFDPKCTLLVGVASGNYSLTHTATKPGPERTKYSTNERTQADDSLPL